MNDDIRRMFLEGIARVNDAEILARSTATSSDSSAILSILGFEVLLKCVIRLSGPKVKKHHRYADLWLDLPSEAAQQILDTAKNRMPIHTNFSNLSKLLNCYQFVFEKARYHYELYEGYTFEEQRELGKFWEELGAPTHEAVIQYHPQELFCLIEALKIYIERWLSINNMQTTYEDARN